MIMSDNILMAFLGFVGSLLVILKPIINLNTNITELKMSIDQFKESINKLDSRITEHGRDIDKMRESLADHEARIKALETR